MPLLGEGEPPSLLGVLTRNHGRRFSEEDVDRLHELVETARPPISRALNLRESDVVPQLDMLTNLLDRHSFYAVLEREILRARLAHHPLALLVIDVDRLTWLNARIGILSADGVLSEVAERLRGVVHRLDYAFRLGGGKFAVVRPGSEGGDARLLFEALRAELAAHPVGEAGVVSVTGGITELVPRDDVESFAARAEAALAEAKGSRRGTVAVAGESAAPRANGTLHIASPSGEIVIEG
jgi:diguanylate cyclase (GGDEF)-like protein